MTTTIPDTIERELELAHPVERVWAAITDPAELTSWFPDTAELDVRPGGDGHFTFGEDRVPVRVEAVEPMTRFVWSWGSGTELTDDRRTVVEFTLEPTPAGTRLRLVESGFATHVRGAAQRDDNIGGWQQMFDRLVTYLG